MVEVGVDFTSDVVLVVLVWGVQDGENVDEVEVSIHPHIG